MTYKCMYHDPGERSLWLHSLVLSMQPGRCLISRMDNVRSHGFPVQTLTWGNQVQASADHAMRLPRARHLLRVENRLVMAALEAYTVAYTSPTVPAAGNIHPKSCLWQAMRIVMCDSLPGWQLVAMMFSEELCLKHEPSAP